MAAAVEVGYLLNNTMITECLLERIEAAIAVKAVRAVSIMLALAQADPDNGGGDQYLEDLAKPHVFAYAGLSRAIEDFRNGRCKGSCNGKGHCGLQVPVGDTVYTCK